jgi:hypothetical protein
MTTLEKVGFIFSCVKNETFAKFKIFKELVKCEIGKKIGALKEIVEGNSHLQTFNDYCQTHRIKRQLTQVLTPQ